MAKSASSLRTAPCQRCPTDRLPGNHQRQSIYRRGWDDYAPTAAGEGVRDERLAALEAVLIAADEPLNARRLAVVTGLKDGVEVRRLMRKLQSHYRRDGSSFQVEEIAGGFQLLTRPEFQSWVIRLRRSGHDLRLSTAARETLAIVAYRQPIMRADIEGIRGVQCGELLRQLMEKGLIRICGRHPSLGRPVLYGTTRKFLQLFGLNSLRDLPAVEPLRPPDSAAAPATDPPPIET